MVILPHALAKTPLIPLGFMYQGEVPHSITKWMRFARNYWGCENVAAWVKLWTQAPPTPTLLWPKPDTTGSGRKQLHSAKPVPVLLPVPQTQDPRGKRHRTPAYQCL